MTDIQGLLQLMLQSQANRQGAIISALQNPPSNIGVSRADSEKHANRGLARWYKMNPGAAPAMPENPFGRGKYADGLLQGVVDAQNNYRNIMSGAPRLQTAKGDLINSNYPGQTSQGSSATSQPLTVPNLSGAADVQPTGNGLLDLTQFNPAGAPAQNVLSPANTDAEMAKRFVSPLPQQNVDLSERGLSEQEKRVMQERKRWNALSLSQKGQEMIEARKRFENSNPVPNEVYSGLLPWSVDAANYGLATLALGMGGLGERLDTLIFGTPYQGLANREWEQNVGPMNFGYRPQK